MSFTVQPVICLADEQRPGAVRCLIARSFIPLHEHLIFKVFRRFG